MAGTTEAATGTVAIRPTNLIYFNQVDAGNHFTAWQEPDIFTTELRAGFRSLGELNRSRHD